MTPKYGCRSCPLLAAMVMCLVLWHTLPWRHTFFLYVDVVGAVVMQVLGVQIVPALLQCILALTVALCGRCRPNLTSIQ